MADDKYVVTMTVDTLAWAAGIVLGGLMILASRPISEVMSGERPSREKLASSRFVVIAVGLGFVLLSVVALITGGDVARHP